MAMKTADYIIWGAGLAGAGVMTYFTLKSLWPGEAPPAPAELTPVTPPQQRSGDSSSAPQGPMMPITKTVEGYVKGVRQTITVTTIGGDKWLRSDAAQAFLAMAADAKRAGVQLMVASAWRSNEKQAELYEAYRRGTGNKAAAPGYSNHQAGLSVDISTGKAPQGYLSPTYRWLWSNASKYGFKNDVAGEPWHWTYKGAVPVDSSLAGLGSLNEATTAELATAGASGAGTVLALGLGAFALYALSKGSKGGERDYERECEEAAERWVPKCVIEKKKAKR